MAQQVEMTDFEQLLTRLLSSDNTMRQAGEETYKQLLQDPSRLVMMLLEVLGSTGVPEKEPLRTMSAVLIRRVVQETGAPDESGQAKTLYQELSPDVRALLKTRLLELIASVQSRSLCLRICDTVGELAITAVHRGDQWGELLAVLKQWAEDSSNERLREASLTIFGSLQAILQPLLKDISFVTQMVQTFQQGLQDPVSMKVQLSALSACSQFLVVLNKEARQHFQPLVPLMLQTINTSVVQGSDVGGEGVEAIQSLIEMAEARATFFKPYLQAVESVMVAIAQDPSVDEDTQAMAVEFMLTLVEKAPTMARRSPMVLSLCKLSVGMMLSLDDDTDEWAKSEEGQNEMFTERGQIGREALDRLAIAAKGGDQGVLAPLMTIVPSYLAQTADQDGVEGWMYRVVGVRVVGLIGEGCQEQMSAILGEVLQLILPLREDPHPRVRAALACTIGNLCDDFGPPLQQTFHAQLLQTLVLLLSDAANPRVVASAASALINFCDMCPSELLVEYADMLLQRLVDVLALPRLVQQEAVTAIASLASTLKASFGKYYAAVMPLLTQILVQSQVNGQPIREFRLLRGKTFECIGVIAVAVGVDVFRGDAIQVMEAMRATQETMSVDDPQTRYLMQAWGSLAQCLGKEFAPFLPYVMPSVLRVMHEEVDLHVFDGSEGDVDSPKWAGWDICTIGDHKIGLHTSLLDDKIQALQQLTELLKLKEHIAVYLAELVQPVLSMLTFILQDELRVLAATVFPMMIASARAGVQHGMLADPGVVSQLLALFLKTVQSDIKTIEEEEVLGAMLEGIHSAIESAGPGQMDQAQMSTLVTSLSAVHAASRERRIALARKKVEDEVDEEEAEELDDRINTEEVIQGSIAECYGQLLKHYQDQFLPLWEQLIPVWVGLLAPDSPPEDRQVALCMFDDCMEHLGARSVVYFQHFLPSMISEATSQSASVRQAAVYGLGVAAEVGGDTVAQVLPQVIDALYTVISAPGAKDEKNVYATENAISSLGKVLTFQQARIDAQRRTELLTFWLSSLPVTNDKAEAKVVYRQLLNFVERNDVGVIGNNGEHVSLLVNLFVSLLHTPMLDDQLTQRIVAVVSQWLSSMPDRVNPVLAQAETVTELEPKSSWLRQAISGSSGNPGA